MYTTTTTITPASSVFTGAGFWEAFWRTAGIQAVALGILVLIIQADHPVLAVVLSGLAVLNLMWFAAALKSTLAQEGKGGWGSAVSVSSAVLGGLLFLISNPAVLSDFHAVGLVISSFPRAMLIMAGTFGLWRAKLISNGLFALGVAAVVLVLLGGSTWMAQGVWAPDGIYSRVVSPLIGVAWIAVLTRVLLKRGPSVRSEW